MVRIWNSIAASLVFATVLSCGKKETAIAIKNKVHLAVLLIFLFGCESKKPLEHIEIYSINPGSHFPMSIGGCDFVRSEAVKKRARHLQIDDSEFIQKFLAIYSKYKPVEQSDVVNIKYQVILHKKTGNDTLCMGGQFDTFINGRKVNDSPEMFALLGDAVWAQR